tara:strand:- start:1305 stop:1625 length:321 start_codon:yes stop_codon:yes gene_type:complete
VGVGWNELVYIQGGSAMADHHPQHIHERLIQAAITKSVSEKLGGLSRELGELTKDMGPADTTEARLMLLGMVRTACGEFCTKMKARVEREQHAHREQMEAQAGMDG